MMEGKRNLNYFTISSTDLLTAADTGNHVFNNDDVSIILNGRPWGDGIFREGEVYQVAEPRLLLFMNGDADVHLDLEQYHLEKGTVIVSMPDVILEFERFSPDVAVCGIGMKKTVHVDENIVLNTDAKDLEVLLRMMHLLWDIATWQPFRRDAVLKMVGAMVANVQYIRQASDNARDKAPMPRHQELFQQFKTLVSRHCEQERNIPFYAGEMRISPHHLSAVISRASGHSALYWINRAVVLRAKVLLHTSNLLTYEIADRLHFANPPAFNNFFKRETGLTPMEYRESK